MHLLVNCVRHDRIGIWSYTLDICTCGSKSYAYTARCICAAPLAMGEACAMVHSPEHECVSVAVPLTEGMLVAVAVRSLYMGMSV